MVRHELLAAAGLSLLACATGEGESRASSAELELVDAVEPAVAPAVAPAPPAREEQLSEAQQKQLAHLPNVRRMVSYYGACYGPCPIYKLTLERDGSVGYAGGWFVRELGNASAKVEPEVAEALLAALLTIELDAGPGWYGDDTCEEWGTHSPESRIDLEFDDHTRYINVDHRCHGNLVLPQLIEFQERLAAELGADRWVDPLFVECAIIYGVDRLYPSDPRYVRSAMIDNILDELREDPTSRLIVRSAASRRDKPGAARARAERFVADFVEAGGDATRVEITDEGTDLASYELGDKRIELDEWIFGEVVSQGCIDSGSASRWREMQRDAQQP